MRLILLFLLVGAFCSAMAGELEDLLAKHYEAIGGLENMRKLQSIRMTGATVRRFRGNQMESPIKRIVKDRKMIRVETSRRGRNIVRVYDGENGWMINPRDGETAQDMPKAMAVNFAAEADFFGDLFQWQEKGGQLVYLGKEDVEGTEAHKIEATSANGVKQTHYLDAEYFVLIKTVGTGSFRGRDIESHAFYSDYKQVGGLLLAHAITVKSPDGETRMETRYERIELNPEIDDSIFKKPDGA